MNISAYASLLVENTGIWIILLIVAFARMVFLLRLCFGKVKRRSHQRDFKQTNGILEFLWIWNCNTDRKAKLWHFKMMTINKKSPLPSCYFTLDAHSICLPQLAANSERLQIFYMKVVMDTWIKTIRKIKSAVKFMKRTENLKISNEEKGNPNTETAFGICIYMT